MDHHNYNQRTICMDGFGCSNDITNNIRTTFLGDKNQIRLTRPKYVLSTQGQVTSNCICGTGRNSRPSNI